ncbi:ROK family protein [Thermoproteota archaeon]
MRNYILSIDLGGTNAKLAILDRRLSIRHRVYFSTKDFISSRQALISEIVKRADALLKAQNLKRSQICGVGIGVPGPVDFIKGKIYFLPNIPYWENTPIRQILSRRMRLRVVVDNDVNLMTLAETTLGAAKGANNAICLTLGTGVGGGLLLDGKIFRGSSFCAGELGHIPISIDGPRCNCGGRGCLEKYVGNAVITAKAKKIFRRRDMTCEKLSYLANNNNKKAISIYQDFSRKIGIGLAGVVNVLNPEIIVIGGGLSNAGPFLFKEIKKTINERAMPIQSKLVRVRKAALGNDAGLIGAALLVLKDLKFKV